jgi:acyl dehydratase
MADYQYFEDLTAGLSMETSSYTVTEPEMIAFAIQFDPQPMHTNPVAAKSITGGLISSGWHTASLTMRLMVTDGRYNPAPGTLGLGFESLKWLKPVRPGDALHLRIEVTDARPSQSKPDRGIITNRVTTLNQHGEPVQEMVSRAIVPKRPA